MNQWKPLLGCVFCDQIFTEETVGDSGEYEVRLACDLSVDVCKGVDCIRCPSCHKPQSADSPEGMMVNARKQKAAEFLPTFSGDLFDW